MFLFENYLVWYELLYVGEMIIRLGMLPVVIRNRRPTSAMAWLLVIFFLPWVGLILYFLIGTQRLPRKRIAKHRRMLAELRGVASRFEEHASREPPHLGPAGKEAVQLAEKLAYMPILRGNSVEFLSETEDVIERLIADIDAAKHHVHLLFYIFADDATGRRVADALRRAVDRGVKCRLLIDAVGSRPFFRKMAGELIADGIELHPTLPVNLFRRQAARIDLRNHRKVAVIDGHIAYTGSQNIVDASYGHKDLAWHDLMVRVTGPITLELQAVFISDWYFETDELLNDESIFPHPELTGDTPVQTLPSGPTYPTENYQRMVVAALYAASKRVIFTTPYFVPDEPLMQAIEVAALRGVEVIFVVPMKYDQLLPGAAARAYYSDLLHAGAKLYRYRDGLLHAKTVTIDDGLALLGSSNFDIRSFALNFEISLLLYGPKVVHELRALQEQYIARSVELDLLEWRNRPFWKTTFENMVRLLSPVL